eukprot:m.137831 g.137831  ORF g.137831 m.137831 type:complete len:288 (+) comp9582_c0_seq3:4069-4932(+)
MERMEVFADGEKVLCFHQGLLYEARCTEVKNAEVNGQMTKKYKIHYNKWSKNWDEWVTADRIRKYNDDNLAEKERLENSLKPKPAPASEKKGTPVPEKGQKRKGEDGTDGPGRKGKSGRDSQSPTGEAVEPPKVHLSTQLKHQLVDDYNFIVTENRLVPLPREPNVTDILKSFAAKAPASTKDWTESLRAVFCVALGSRLLYAFEREQYRETLRLTPVEKISDIYGAEHLLRLLCRLPDLFSETDTKVPQGGLVQQLLDHLDKRYKDLFVKEYDNASPAYIRTALHL